MAGKYTYLSWIRKGMATRISDVDKLGGVRSTIADRAEVNITVNVNSSSAVLDGRSKKFDLLGPGDIRVKALGKTDAFTVPVNKRKEAEYNNFPYIQFYDEDFPWRFSPAKANAKQQLRPWLQLVALKAGEFDEEALKEPHSQTQYHILKIAAGVPVPNHREAYLWAHVQIEKALTGDKKKSLEDIIASDPDAVTSRIICPRKLEKGTEYHMFLIPAFERGRLAGIGATTEEMNGVDMQQYAFSLNRTNKEISFPVYHRWSFTTTVSGGDFEELSRKLKKVDSNDIKAGDRTVGSRKFFALDIGDGLKYTGNHLGEKGQMEMIGALLPDGKKHGSRLANLKTKKFTKDLAAYLNDPLGTHEDYEDDPIIAPPIYGAHHAGSGNLSPLKNTWISEVNLDLGNRLIAGLGAEVFKEHQDAFMQEAWKQQGDVEEANRKINMASLLEMTNGKLHNKYIEHASNDKTVAMTSLLHGRIKFGVNSVKQVLHNAGAPTTTFTVAFQQAVSNGTSFLKNSKASTQQSIISTAQSKSSTPVTSYNLSSGGYIQTKAQTKSSLSKLARSTASLSKMAISQTTSTTTKSKERTSLKTGLNSFSSRLDKRTVAVAAGSTLNMSKLNATITNALLPSTTLLSKLNGIIQLNAGQLTKVEKVMAYPVITTPMSSFLKVKHLDMFIPQLDLLPENSVTILSSNQKYIEALLLGFNYEMARELAWRDYPTDQRGSYARVFWESVKQSSSEVTPSEIADEYGHINEVHKWKRGSNLTQLGENPNPKNDIRNNLVVVFRGDLLKYYPNTVIYFNKAQKSGQNARKLSSTISENVYPSFIDKIGSDIHLIGFDLSTDEAKGIGDSPGYFLVMQEPPGENKFGMDISSNVLKPEDWSDLAWDQFKDATQYVKVNDFKFPGTTINGAKWGENSNHMAHILNQKLFKYAIHAENLI